MLRSYPVPGKAKSAMLCEAFVKGAPKNAEGTVFFGVKAGNYADWRRVRASGEDWYFGDNSSFDGPARGTQFRVVKNRLQPTGLGESDGKRFAALGIPIKPWRPKDGPGHIVLVEQSPDHMRYVAGDPNWFNRLALQLCKTRLILRPWSANKPKLQSTLADDLVDARLLITHTSAAAINAALAGVPVGCHPDCAATYGGSDVYAERLQWASVLADNQATVPEIEKGLAWRALNP